MVMPVTIRFDSGHPDAYLHSRRSQQWLYFQLGGVCAMQN